MIVISDVDMHTTLILKGMVYFLTRHCQFVISFWVSVNQRACGESNRPCICLLPLCQTRAIPGHRHSTTNLCHHQHVLPLSWQRVTPPRSVLHRLLPPLISLLLSTHPLLLPFIHSLPSSFILLLTLLYLCYPLSDSPVYSLLKPLFPLFRYLILFLSSLLTPFPRCFLLFFLFLPTLTHSPALSSHQKVLDFDICLQEQWPMK